MTDPERKLAARLLVLASDEFSLHGCNDFDLESVMPDVEQRRALMRDVWAKNGAPEYFDPDDCDNTDDSLLMQYFAERLWPGILSEIASEEQGG